MTKDDAHRTAYDLALAVAAGNHKTHFQLPPIDAGEFILFTVTFCTNPANNLTAPLIYYNVKLPSMQVGPLSRLSFTRLLFSPLLWPLPGPRAAGSAVLTAPPPPLLPLLPHCAPRPPPILSRGSAAANDYVSDRMPDRLLLCGSEDDAKSRWEATLAWRKEAGISTLLYTPQLRFDLMNLAYPSFFHGRDKDGDRVWYEQLGRVDVAALLAKGITAEDVLLHKQVWRGEPRCDLRYIMHTFHANPAHKFDSLPLRCTVTSLTP